MSRQGTIRRYTLIIEKIKRNQFPSFSEIENYLIEADFVVSRRTIERDIKALRDEFGVEIVYNHHKEGYSIDYESSYNIETFLRFLEIASTAELISDSMHHGKETLNYVSFDTGGGLKGIEWLKPLLQATKEHRKITFNHFSYQSKQTRTYKMMPYLLKEYQNRWYIVGVVSGMNEVRTFGIDRIEDLEVLPDFFERDPAITPMEFFKKSIGVMYSVDVQQKVVLSFSPNQGYYIKSLPIHPTQQILLDNEEELQISLFVVPNFELTQRILMFGSSVKVLQPQWLVDSIVATLKESLDKY